MEANPHAKTEFSCAGKFWNAQFPSFLTKHVLKHNFHCMSAWEKATRSAVLVQIFLMFSLSTGIDELENHCPAIRVFQANAGFVIAARGPDNQGRDHCNACFFNQLLNQCLFPILGEPAISESSHKQICLFTRPTLFPELGHEVNRGPPAL